MDGLHQWAQENGVRVSLKKTTTTLLSPEGAAPPERRHLRYGTQPVKQTDVVRLLGLWIDADWSFSTHVGQVAEKMERIECVIKKKVDEKVKKEVRERLKSEERVLQERLIEEKKNGSLVPVFDLTKKELGLENTLID